VGIYDSGMVVTIKTDKLLERLKANRTEHIRVYNESLKLWQNELTVTCHGIEGSDYVDFPGVLKDLNRDCPTSHELEYDRVIDMFGMSTQDEIELSGDMFNQYCRDEWDWKQSVMSNKYYSMTSTN
jgi:hypothetical protein